MAISIYSNHEEWGILTLLPKKQKKTDFFQKIGDPFHYSIQITKLFPNY